MTEQKLKVLIVDDEEIVRHGLEKIIDWEKLGCAICGEASTGEEALEQLVELAPSIVLLDINMPGQTGIDVIKQVHDNPQNFPSKPKFLILSGYSDFDYAQKALNFGAKGYIVKPIDEDELEEKIRAIKKDIVSEAEIATLRSSAEKEELASRFKQLFVQGTTRSIPTDEFTQKSQYQVAIVSLERAGCVNGETQQFEASAEDCFVYLKHFSFVMDASYVIVFCDEGEETVKRHLERLCLRLQKNKTGSIASLGMRKASLEGALESYNEAHLLYQQLFFFTEKPYIVNSDLESDEDSALRLGKKPDGFDSNYIFTRIPELTQYIEIYDLQKINVLMEQLRKWLKTSVLSIEEIKKLCMAFIVDTQNSVHTKHPEKELETVPALDLVNLIYTQYYFDEMMDIVIDFTTGLAESFTSNTASSTILKVIQYVKTNYNRELKLELLGDLFNCNSAYLGKKFKEYTGVPFNTYLDIIRIEQAKNMLETTSLKIYEISKLVGYSNTDYFYLKFKKHTNMTPKEFKRTQEEKQ